MVSMAITGVCAMVLMKLRCQKNKNLTKNFGSGVQNFWMRHENFGSGVQNIKCDVSTLDST